MTAGGRQGVVEGDDTVAVEHSEEVEHGGVAVTTEHPDGVAAQPVQFVGLLDERRVETAHGERQGFGAGDVDSLAAVGARELVALGEEAVQPCA